MNPQRYSFISTLPVSLRAVLLLVLLTMLAAGCATGRTMTVCPDCTYTGDTQDGQMHGQGSALYHNGDKYEGAFVQGQRHGQGTYVWANGDKYVGEWVDNSREGQGTMTFHTGDRYEGAWNNDTMHGQGTFTWANGDQYVGSYVNGKRHGEGTLTYADGRVEKGMWKFNKLPSEEETPPPVTVEENSRDTQPPHIRITSHEMFRGIAIVPVVPYILVTGVAEDPSGVSEVTVNGETAKVDGSGRFSIKIPLVEGRNEVTVLARDAFQNQAQKMFWLEAKEDTRSLQDEIQAEIAPQFKTGKYHALIIGINNYRHLPPLETAVNDAKEVERILKHEYGFSTTLLLNADRADIMNGFNEVREQLTSDDNLLIYYAGHGEFDKAVNKAYWLPVDAQPDNDTNWIIVDNITTNIRRMSTRHVLVVADSCYSGTLTRSSITKLTTADEKQRFLKKMMERSSRTLMASGGNEPVADGGGGGHSIFASVFLRALRSTEENTFTAEQLFHSYIKEAVAGQAQQVPEYNIIKNSGHAGGDFVFIRKP
ncbi:MULTISPECIES: caspase family protein [unclassified Nitrospina]|uniref:caspase family protein n=1 Tax=unclassified Nitrospina TaxID=2638683 RepID=UPI003F9D851A